MRVGCPKEIKDHEYRVGLTPGSVREYVAHGHDVIIETNAGAGIDADDGVYQAAGAKIVSTAKEVFEQSDMIVKVKEPQPAEWAMLREDQLLYTYLHLAPDPEQTKGLVDSGCTAIAYETVTDDHGGLPLLAPMSEVAGRLAIQAGATALQKANGGRGVLLGGVPGVLPAKVTVIGGGVVGLNAAKMAVGLGAEVTILDRSIPRMRQLDDIFNGRVRTRFSTIEALENEVFSADVVVGAVLVPGAAAPKLVTRDMLSGMKKGAVIVDVAIDQGGCFETSKPTTPLRSDLRSRRDCPLLRRQHARSGSGYVGPCAEQRDAALRTCTGRQGVESADRRPPSARGPQRSPWTHHQQGRCRCSWLRAVGADRSLEGRLKFSEARVQPIAGFRFYW